MPEVGTRVLLDSDAREEMQRHLCVALDAARDAFDLAVLCNDPVRGRILHLMKMIAFEIDGLNSGQH